MRTSFRRAHLLLTVAFVVALLAACSAPPAERVEAGIDPELLAVSFEKGIPYRLELPAIKLDTPVVELGWSARKDRAGQIFSEWDVANNAAGWHKNSGLPGSGGNVVLSGHNNILGAVFRELDQLKRGDRAYLFVGDSTYEYAIDQVLIVPEKRATAEQRKQNASYIQPTDDNRLTLVSCWPRDDNTHRIIVIAHPVQVAERQ